jgi:FAD/FMN-containing dehydrogenase
MSTSLQVRDAARELATTFGGQILMTGDAGYDEARRVHNGMIDKHPAVIARCRGTADIVAAVKFGRAHDLEIAVRGGGHNVAGRATVQDGLMIDLSLMRGVHVDPKARRARAQGGATWGDFNRETQVHGLATPGGVISTTGVSGLTLGGGVGWLLPLYGLSLDNLVSIEVVTADGEVVNASADEHADLFWAMRGGSGNFGVAASLEFRVHPVGPAVTGGVSVHPFPRAREVLRFYRAATRGFGDDTAAVCGLTHAPDGSGVPVAALVAVHFGNPADGEKVMAPIKAFGPPVMDAIGPTTYNAMNSMLDRNYPRGALNYWKTAMLPELSDAAIDAIIASFERCPSPMTALIIEHFHGKFCRIGATETAFPHRAPGYNLLIIGQWDNASQSEANIAWTRATFEAVKPFAGQGRYVNYLGDDETQDSVAAAYGPNYRRLREVKAKYDPGNVFHLNQNIKP